MPIAPPDHAIDQRQIQAALAQAIAKLPLEHAELFHLRSQGMSYEEMADVLTIPIGTVKSRMHQMVARLRQEMKT